MSKYLDRAKELRAIVSPHYNCAQSVIVPFAEDAGIDEETAMKVAANFGMGMKRGSVCGSITGGLIVLGLFGADDPETVSKFHRGMAENHDGMTECRDLLRVNSEKGLERKPHCDAMVYESVELLEKLLKEKGVL